MNDGNYVSLVPTVTYRISLLTIRPIIAPINGEAQLRTVADFLYVSLMKSLASTATIVSASNSRPVVATTTWA